MLCYKVYNWKASSELTKSSILKGDQISKASYVNLNWDYHLRNILINQTVIELPEEMNRSILRFKQGFSPILRKDDPWLFKYNIRNNMIPVISLTPIKIIELF